MSTAARNRQSMGCFSIPLLLGRSDTANGKKSGMLIMEPLDLSSDADADAEMEHLRSFGGSRLGGSPLCEHEPCESELCVRRREGDKPKSQTVQALRVEAKTDKRAEAKQMQQFVHSCDSLMSLKGDEIDDLEYTDPVSALREEGFAKARLGIPDLTEKDVVSAVWDCVRAPSTQESVGGMTGRSVRPLHIGRTDQRRRIYVPGDGNRSSLRASGKMKRCAESHGVSAFGRFVTSNGLPTKHMSVL